MRFKEHLKKARELWYWPSFFTGVSIILAIFALALALELWPVVKKVLVEPQGSIEALKIGEAETFDFASIVETPQEFEVRGTCADLPKRWRAWVCVFPMEAGRYYPQQEPLEVRHDEWDREVWVGQNEPEEEGKIFIVSLVAACPVACDDLQEAADGSRGIECLPCSSYILDEVMVRRVVETSMASWHVTSEANLMRIAHGTDTNLVEYAVLHLESGYLQMTYGPSGGWGTSVVLLPSFWEEGQYRQGAPVSASYEEVGRDLVITVTGKISRLDVHASVRLALPGENRLSASVSVDVQGDADVDIRPGEAFKPVMLSSMRISESKWDCQFALTDYRSFSIPPEGWIQYPPVPGRVIGLKGGTSDLRVNAPTIQVDLGQDLQVSGWVTPSDDPNRDNVAFWAASDNVMASWQYTVEAAV
jgi:hypothetical protein